MSSLKERERKKSYHVFLRFRSSHTITTKNKTKTREPPYNAIMMYHHARGLDWAHQTHHPLRRISQSRAGGPEKLAFAALSVGLVTAGRFVAKRNQEAMKRHSIKPYAFDYPLLSSGTSMDIPFNVLLDDNVQPIMFTVKAEAWECRETELRSHYGDQSASRPGPHEILETFKYHNMTKMLQSGVRYAVKKYQCD